eukprot:8170722-Alexandrium_andersonii.AAC.1
MGSIALLAAPSCLAIPRRVGRKALEQPRSFRAKRPTAKCTAAGESATDGLTGSPRPSATRCMSALGRKALEQPREGRAGVGQ